MEKYRVAIYDRKPETMKFLSSFFESRKEYSTTVFSDAAKLKKSLQDGFHFPVIVGTGGCLEEAAQAVRRSSVIAMVENDLASGLAQVMKYNIESYLLSPFNKDDLEYKLRVVRNRQRIINGLFGKVKDLEAIVELSYLMSSTLDPREVLNFMVKKIGEAINVSRCSIIGLEHGEKRYAEVVSSCEPPEFSDLKIDLKKYPEIRKAHRLGKPVIIKDALKDPLMKQVSGIVKDMDIKAIMVIPIVYRDEVIGSLFLRTSRASRQFTEKEINFCQEIAKAAVNPLYNAFLFERMVKEKTRLERLSITDYLTGAYNVRYLYHRMEDEFQRAKRYGTSLGCIMFDLDYFKKINDTYGHKAGDMVLREFCQIVKKQIRKTDVFARYGGEEFVMLMIQTGAEGAMVEGRRLMETIKKYHFKALGDKTGITVSMGMSIYPDERISMADDLITLADDALFKAKNQGRDRMVLA